ncbi:TlpA disulfide reductase family protein [Chitinophaga niabensis]|uniref:TlpA family protein disulfide reductase n=1 Tax=Chitinophaga niabensis TaxID=536979 RepID=UPI0031B9B026
MERLRSLFFLKTTFVVSIILSTTSIVSVGQKSQPYENAKDGEQIEPGKPFTGNLNEQKGIAQQPKETSSPFVRLNIGDKVPDITFMHVKNHPGKTIKLSDFKGKLLIIDFWNKWCIPCISAFPKMEELQNKFGDNIQILLVTSDKDQQLQSLFQNSEIIKNTKLPIITADTVLNKLFPHTAVPYHVWIDKEGFVKATLSDYNTNSSTIQKYINEGKADFTKRQDIFSHEIKYGSLLNQLKGTDYNQMQQIQAYTLFTKLNLYNSGSMMLIDTASKRILNFSIVDLFRAAYGNNYLNAGIEEVATQYAHKVPVKVTVIAKTPEARAKYFYPKRSSPGYDAWLNENIYCYEKVFEPSIMKLPPSKRARVQDSLVIMDLERYFTISSSIRNANEKCLVIYRRDKTENFKAKGGEPLQEKTEKNVIRIRNYSISTLTAIIEGYFLAYSGEYPIINETGYEGPIDVDFGVGDRSIEKLDQDLSKYGLGIKEDLRMVRSLTLKEN